MAGDLTWVNVVRCRLRAGVGQDAVVGVWPACWGRDEIPLPGDEMLPDTDESPLFGSGFSFLKAPSAKEWVSGIFFGWGREKRKVKNA